MLERMFESSVREGPARAEPPWAPSWTGSEPWQPDGAEVGAGEWPPVEDPPLAMGGTVPSGFFALELDLATESPAVLTDAELVDAMVGWDRLAAWAVARQYAVLAEFARRPGDGSIRPSTRAAPAREWAADEVALAVTVSPGSARVRLAYAARLDGPLSATRDLLRSGRIDPSRARLICDRTAVLDDVAAAAVQDRVLPRAPGMTWAQLDAALRRAVLAVDTEGAVARHRRARAARRVEVFAGEDGMATLWARLSAVDAAASFAWVTRLARGMDTAGDPVGDPRGIDARRADVLTALLTGNLVYTHTADPGAGGAGVVQAKPVGAARPLVHVTVALTTLRGVDDAPGELAGYGPIPAHMARDVAMDATAVWRRLRTDPDSGALLDHGRTVYRPPAALAEFVRARDQACRNPRCTRAARGCELDHVTEWHDHGDTAEHNLCALCVRHHDLKEQPGWRVRLHPDRRVEWITPTGHRYWSRPHDHRPTTPPHPDLDPAPSTGTPSASRSQTEPAPSDPAGEPPF